MEKGLFLLISSKNELKRIFYAKLLISSLSRIILKFRTHQEEKTYDGPVNLGRKEICLLNTDLRSVSKAALRKLWHSKIKDFGMRP